MKQAFSFDAEWLETDGLGGFASGTVSTRRTRRYHAWLLAAKTPPTGRFVLVNGGDVSIETAERREFLSIQHYLPKTDAADIPTNLESFVAEPWPTWTYRLENGRRIRQEILSVQSAPTTILRWTLLDSEDPAAMRLVVRPFLSGRDYHATHHENPSFRFAPQIAGGLLRWEPYPGVPSIHVLTNGAYVHEPLWYRNFFYSAERERGLDDTEDLAAPGTFSWDLSGTSAVMSLTADETVALPDDISSHIETLIETERTRRSRFPSPLHRSADAYVVRRGSGRTLIAGYPWFTDWGRDTFIALRGLCLATRRLELAEEILLSWAPLVSDGMLPNRFPDAGTSPEFNSVDASLWYAIVVADFFRVAQQESYPISTATRVRLEFAVDQILRGYAQGTRFRIRMDHDGLIAAGVPGVQLTWMDAKVGHTVVTPRVGKPVEIQALWLNALHAFQHLSPDYESWFRQGRETFERRFWNAKRQYLYDVIDEWGQLDRNDDSFRPNQIFAVGGLPLSLLPPKEAKAVVAAVEKNLLTPWGLRTLSPQDRVYRGRFAGGMPERDAAYHQGTVWPWLMGPFVEAWLRVRGRTSANFRLARARFLDPLEAQLQSVGIGHLPEVADGDPPFRPGGCPFQAWSLGEFLRLKFDVLPPKKTRGAQQKTPV